MADKEKWIPIFEGGIQTDSNGNEREWSDDDLDLIVTNYDARKDDAPIVIGHPKTDAPAWGWVEALKRNGKMLLAKFKQVDEKFAEMVNAGRFKYRSIAVTPDLRLRHIGFLGAAAPAIPGLGEVKFDAEQEFAVYDQEFSLDGWIVNSIGRLFRSLRDWLIETKGKETADEILPDYKLESIESYESKPDEKALPAYNQDENQEVVEMENTISKEQHEAELAKFGAKVTDLESQLAAFKQKEAEAKQADRDRVIAQFCDSLQKDGAELTPKSRSLISEFMQSIAEVQEYEFSEGDGKKRETPLQRFQAIVNGGLEFMSTGEQATKDKAKTVNGTAGEKLAELAKDMMTKNPGMTFSAAFRQVQKENIELAQEYSQTLI